MPRSETDNLPGPPEPGDDGKEGPTLEPLASPHGVFPRLEIEARRDKLAEGAVCGVKVEVEVEVEAGACGCGCAFAPLILVSVVDVTTAAGGLTKTKGAASASGTAK